MMTLLDLPTSHSPDQDRLVLWPCALALLGCMMLGLVLSTWPRAGAPVAVVFAPWVSLDDMQGRIVAAGGDLIDFGGFANVVVARSDDLDFVQQLYGQGALWAMDGAFTASLCRVGPIL